MFGKVLIANRGEIALRVARTCRELGVRTVAVYSTEDRDAPVVAFADEAVCIGPAPARRSYLNGAAILEAAARTGAEAVHPGYGFLSEDPDFAEACEDAGVVFIGPPSHVVASLGNKAAARAAMSAAGLPLLPGSVEPVERVEEGLALAAGIGYPVIIKAAAGGGGRGMSVVTGPEQFAPAYARTRAEARALFGDDRVFVERYLARARHVEVQILCDAHGAGVHLGERDCSVQRRHQKLVEETPAPGLPREVAAAMGQAAVAGARSAGYVGAGTFEFLVDEHFRYFFMEVNCRIQVEHPVTEMATGIDLVAEQLRVAAGEPLRFSQHDIVPRGAALECRVNAEDPWRGFLPTPGPLTVFTPPGGPFVRVDTAGSAGARVSASYDSLLAKLVVWAPDRAGAIARMRRALAEFHIDGPGVRTTVEFLGEVLADRRFVAGEHSTALVDQLLAEAEAEAEAEAAEAGADVAADAEIDVSADDLTVPARLGANAS